MIFAVVVLLGAAFSLAAFIFGRSRTRIPAYKGEGRFSFLADAHDYAVKPIELLRKASVQCGNIFSIQVLTVYNVFLRGNELNRVYLETREDVWSFGGGMGLFLNKILDPGYFDHLKTMVGSLSRYINRSAAQKYTATVTIEETQKSAQEWAGTGTETIEIFDAMSVLVHKVIVRTLMGEDFYSHDCTELLDLLHAMESDIGSLYSFVLPEWVPHPPARRLQAARDRVKQIFLERLRQRDLALDGKPSDANDYITYTLNDKSTAPFMSLMPSHHTLLMFAAHTSTVANIAWTIISLLRNPEILRAVQVDLRSTDNPELPSTLLQACIKETSRFYSGMKMLRLARQQTTIPGTDLAVPKGTVVSISPYLTHHDPANFADPDAWTPARWIGPDGELMTIDLKAPGGIRFMPFGAGSHRCVGEKMAGIIVTKALTALLRDYEVSFEGDPRAVNWDALDFDKIGSPWLKGGVRVRVEKRAWPEVSAGC